MLHPYGPLPTRSTCPDCKGSGVDRETDLLCDGCDGSGAWKPSPARQVAEALGGGVMLLAVFFLGWSAMVLA